MNKAEQAQRRIEIADATPQSERERIVALAFAHNVKLPSSKETPLEDVDPVVRPAARMFAAIAAELKHAGFDPVTYLNDSRFDALYDALEVTLEQVTTALEQQSSAAVNAVAFSKARVELDALRGVEPLLLDILAKLREAIAAAQHEREQQEQAQAALSQLVLPEHVAQQRAADLAAAGRGQDASS